MKKILIALIILFAFAVPAIGMSFEDGQTTTSIRGDGLTDIPSTAPTLQRDNVYGWQTTDAIAKTLEVRANQQQGSATDQPQAANASQITVTATVLPVRTLVVLNGEIIEVWSNTTDLVTQNSLYRWTEKSIDGESIAITPELWQLSKPALETMRTDITGKVWNK
jgi:hypothetical protein